jgi:hypothetical protein
MVDGAVGTADCRGWCEMGSCSVADNDQMIALAVDPAVLGPSWTYICIDSTYMCMRTTLDIDDHVLRKAKQLAATEGKTLTRVVEEALRERLVRPRPGARPFRLRLLTKKGRLIPGVNLADRDALYERMEGRG